jgi:hypothetical protein
MQEWYGDLTTICRDRPPNVAVCITTNQWVGIKCLAVMGRGIAYVVSCLYPDFRYLVGKINAQIEKKVVPIEHYPNGFVFINFPVKPDKISTALDFSNIVEHCRRCTRPGAIKPGWMAVADPTIIEDSCQQLVELLANYKFDQIYLPAPGCGAGELDYNKTIKPILLKYFSNNDNIYICHYRPDSNTEHV